MITSQIKVFDHFPEITREVERLAVRGLDAAAHAGAREAARLAAPGLKGKSGMVVIGVHGEVDGYASGFRSTARGKRGQEIAIFHDKGTYGQHKGRLKRSGKRRGRADKVPDVDPKTGERTGIVALGFFGAGRREGRRALKRTIGAGL